MLLVKLEHAERKLDILLIHVLAREIKDDVLLVVWNLLLADMFDELRQSVSTTLAIHAHVRTSHMVGRLDSLHRQPILVLGRSVEICV